MLPPSRRRHHTTEQPELLHRIHSATKVRPLEVHLKHLGAREIHTSAVRTTKIRATQVQSGKVGAPEAPPRKLGTRRDVDLANSPWTSLRVIRPTWHHLFSLMPQPCRPA